MRVDAPLSLLLLSATASAQWVNNNTNATGGYSKNHKQIADLEEEVKNLKEQLDEASHYTCDAGSGSDSGSGSGSGPGSYPTGAGSGAGQTEYSTVVSTIVNTEYQTYPAPTAGSGSGSGSGDSGNGDYNGGSDGAVTSSTLTQYNTEYETNTYTVINTQYVTPVASTTDAAAPTQAVDSGNKSSEEDSDDSSDESSYNGGSADDSDADEGSYTGGSSDDSSDNGSYNGGASNGGSGSGQQPPKYTSNPDYYAPAPAATDKTSVVTTTVIVTPGHSTATSTGTGADGMSTYTCVETYPGTSPIPSPPSTSEGSGSGSGSAAPTTAAGPSSYEAPSSQSSSAPYGMPYPNATAPIGSTGFVSSTRPASSTGFATGISSSSSQPVYTSANNTEAATTSSGFLTGTAASSTSSSATASATLSECESFCSQLTEFDGYEVTPLTCTQLSAGSSVDTPEGQSSVGCAASFTPALDVCQVTLNVKTAGDSETYMEVWLPNGNETAWNGRSMSTDNGGLNGCIHYVDMQYVSSMGFAAIGDNAGHNSSSFDGSWMMNDNQAIVDWSYRARHASVDIGKQTIDSFYSKMPEYSYYIGCSTGGAQGMQSAQMFPDDFDGIISGSSAADFNHLQSWTARFRTITGAEGNDTFLSADDWSLVNSYVVEQCDEPIDGVSDGILEDPLQCQFDVSAIPVCESDDSTGCLTATQIQTVEDVYTPLYFGDSLVYPALLYGSEIDAVRLGLLDGSENGIARAFFQGGVYNDSSFDITTITKEDMMLASSQDALHGYPSAFDGDLSGFQAAGKKMMMYHGMADPMVSGANSQRYYQKVAQTMGLGNDAIDEFYRLYRISGMAHCGVGGISGAGPWMFGQSGAASAASNNIVDNLVNWVENNDAPETLLGTKFWYDTPSMGVEYERAHCRYPYRTTYQGGDSTVAESWGCELIEDWQDCAGVTCNADGSFA